MPLSSASSVRAQLAANAPDPLYLIVGDDDVEKSALAAEFADLVDEGLRAFNVERIHAGDYTTGDRLLDGVGGIVAAARTLPMMVPRRVVVVVQADTLLAPKRESEAAARAMEQLLAYVDQPEPTTTLVFVATSIDKRSKAFKQFQKTGTIVEIGAPDDVAGAERWVRNRVSQAGVEIEPAAARHLAVRAGFPDRPQRDGSGNVKRLRADVDRLLLYALGQKRIGIDEARAVAGAALRQLALVFDAGGEAPMVLGQLGWLVRSKFPALAPASVAPAVDAIFRTDEALKTSGGDPRMLLERLVVVLCGGKRATTGRRGAW